MKQFVVFDPATHEIVRSGFCLDDDLELQGENVIEGEGGNATHYVLNGELTGYTAAQAATKAAAPAYLAAWSNTTFQWLDPRTLDDMKIIKWAQVKAARASAEFGGFTWDGSRFDSDPVSTNRIMGAFALALAAQISGQPFALVWTLADNTTRTLSAADLIAVGVALGTQVGNAHANATARRHQIDVATTAAAIEGVTWGAEELGAACAYRARSGRHDSAGRVP